MQTTNEALPYLTAEEGIKELLIQAAANNPERAIPFAVWQKGATAAVCKMVDKANNFNWSDLQKRIVRQALRETAEMGLTPSRHVNLGAWWEREKKVFDVRPVYRYTGLVHMLEENGCVVYPPKIVYAEDYIAQSEGVRDGQVFMDLEFKPKFTDRGHPIGCFVVWERKGRVFFLFKDKNFFDAVRKFTERGKKGARSGSFATQMWKTSMPNQIRKWVPNGIPDLSGEADTPSQELILETEGRVLTPPPPVEEDRSGGDAPETETAIDYDKVQRDLKEEAREASEAKAREKSAKELEAREAKKKLETDQAEANQGDPTPQTQQEEDHDWSRPPW